MDNNKKWESLTLSNDYIFSRVMRDREICKEVIEALLSIKIDKLEIIEQQKTINIDYDAKSVRLDIYSEDENKMYNVEIQVSNEHNLPKRSRYYQGIIDLNAIDKGEYFDNLKENIIIFICKFDPFEKGLSRYTFTNKCEEVKDLELMDGTKKIFFNTKAYDKAKNEEVKALLEYLEYNDKINNKLISKIDKKVKEVKDNAEWRVEYMTLEMIKQEQFKKGEEKGFKDGEEKGFKDGEEKGFRDGEEKGLKLLVKKYKKIGLSEEEIIEELKEEYKKEEIKKYL